MLSSKIARKAGRNSLMDSHSSPVRCAWWTATVIFSTLWCWLCFNRSILIISEIIPPPPFQSLGGSACSTVRWKSEIRSRIFFSGNLVGSRSFHSFLLSTASWIGKVFSFGCWVRRVGIVGLCKILLNFLCNYQTPCFFSWLSAWPFIFFLLKTTRT